MVETDGLFECTQNTRSQPAESPLWTRYTNSRSTYIHTKRSSMQPRQCQLSHLDKVIVECRPHLNPPRRHYRVINKRKSHSTNSPHITIASAPHMSLLARLFSPCRRTVYLDAGCCGRPVREPPDGISTQYIRSCKSWGHYRSHTTFPGHRLYHSLACLDARLCSLADAARSAPAAPLGQAGSAHQIRPSHAWPPSLHPSLGLICT